MDKQIIIDGCDVSGCEWIREIELDSEYICTCNYPNKTSGYCKYNPNCHYKQLKRKEQELEQVNKAYEECKNSRLKAYNKLQEKEQECEELKEKMEKYCYDCDVAERMRKVIYAATGGRLSYANYTVEAIEQAYNDQLCIDVEYRTKKIEEELNQLKAELEKYKWERIKNSPSATKEQILEKIEADIASDRRSNDE